MGRKEDLESIRAGLMAAFLDASPSILPQIAGQLRATIAELESLEEPEPVAAVGGGSADELRSRREARSGGSTDQPAAQGGGVARQRGGRNRAR